MTENTRVKVCSESSTADQDSVRVEPHKVLEQNDQLQNKLEEQIVKHQKLEKCNAQLHVKLLEEKEKFTVRKQENSMLVGTPCERVEWRSREDTHVSVGTRVDLRVRCLQRQECSAEACWRRRQPDLDRDAARVQVS